MLSANKRQEKLDESRAAMGHGCCWLCCDFLTSPPVENLRSKQATTEPINWAIQYKMLLNNVICPPTRAPKVTAGLTWPPEMLALTATATKSANA